MLISETVYVTPDDFYNVYGRDLREMLESDSNESNQAERFIAMVTSHLKNWIGSNTYRVLDYDCLTRYQLGQWQRAILAQVYYTWKEGAKALGLASGLDDEKGIVIPLSHLQQSEICQASIDYLTNAGLFNLTMKNRPRVMGGMPGYGFFDSDSIHHHNPQPKPEPTPTPAPGVILGIGYTED